HLANHFVARAGDDAQSLYKLLERSRVQDEIVNLHFGVRGRCFELSVLLRACHSRPQFGRALIDPLVIDLGVHEPVADRPVMLYNINLKSTELLASLVVLPDHIVDNGSQYSFRFAVVLPSCGTWVLVPELLEYLFRDLIDGHDVELRQPYEQVVEL